ncbi:MAG: MerR family transcriptional regulator [Gammaproteobacteria bacterium]|nr:MerR family transcriptional regulator [Gammaproteobacteria bacterium]
MKDLEAATGIGREAIRFYIREGMLPEPERPGRNVAYYNDDHVLHIRAIKRLQTEAFLPLAAIRDLMKTADVRALAEGRGPEIAALLPSMLGEGEAGPACTLDAAAAMSGLHADEIEAMARRGIIDIGPDGCLADRDARICRLWGELRAAGFEASDGFDLDHLQRYQEVSAWLADLEVTKFLGTLATRQGSEAAARVGAEGLLLARDLFGALHVRAALRALQQARPSGDSE